MSRSVVASLSRLNEEDIEAQMMKAWQIACDLQSIFPVDSLYYDFLETVSIMLSSQPLIVLYCFLHLLASVIGTVRIYSCPDGPQTEDPLDLTLFTLIVCPASGGKTRPFKKCYDAPLHEIELHCMGNTKVHLEDATYEGLRDRIKNAASHAGTNPSFTIACEEFGPHLRLAKDQQLASLCQRFCTMYSTAMGTTGFRSREDMEPTHTAFNVLLCMNPYRFYETLPEFRKAQGFLHRAAIVSPKPFKFRTAETRAAQSKYIEKYRGGAIHEILVQMHRAHEDFKHSGSSYFLSEESAVLVDQRRDTLTDQFNNRCGALGLKINMQEADLVIQRAVALHLFKQMIDCLVHGSIYEINAEVSTESVITAMELQKVHHAWLLRHLGVLQENLMGIPPGSLALRDMSDSNLVLRSAVLLSKRRIVPSDVKKFGYRRIRTLSSNEIVTHLSTAPFLEAYDEGNGRIWFRKKPPNAVDTEVFKNYGLSFKHYIDNLNPPGLPVPLIPAVPVGAPVELPIRRTSPPHGTSRGDMDITSSPNVLAADLRTDHAVQHHACACSPTSPPNRAAAIPPASSDRDAILPGSSTGSLTAHTDANKQHGTIIPHAQTVHLSRISTNLAIPLVNCTQLTMYNNNPSRNGEAQQPPPPTSIRCAVPETPQSQMVPLVEPMTTTQMLSVPVSRAPAVSAAPTTSRKRRKQIKKGQPAEKQRDVDTSTRNRYLRGHQLDCIKQWPSATTASTRPNLVNTGTSIARGAFSPVTTSVEAPKSSSSGIVRSGTHTVYAAIRQLRSHSQLPTTSRGNIIPDPYRGDSLSDDNSVNL